ncbi:UNVERIFIED_CONTAM: hypothetical protein Sindi_2872100 [Sesamum indicum]
MGDFNYVKSPEEKQLGVAPTWYELKDFVDYCVALGLLDVPTTGCYYTWYSNNESNPVWCKLDRVLYNNEWLQAGLHYSAHFNPPGCLSDHSPGIVSIFDHAPTKPNPFRFFNMWADHPDFLATVEARWNLSVDGTPQFSLCRRLKALKGALKAFNKQHYNHISARGKEAELALQDAQNLRRKVIFLVEAERHFFYQKAKIHFLKEGDRNTKFFHDMVKRNVVRNSIGAVTKADGTVITTAEDIAQEFVDYYTSLLGTETHTLPIDNGMFEWGPILSLEHTAELYRAVTPLEVKDAVFHISDNEAPNPDGYSSCFFKKAWNIVGDQVCRVVLDFFRSGRMLWKLNHTIIALVSKSDQSTSVADYRPISCCNVIYKAITKIISDWLAPVLEHLIDRCQAAFVGGRNITDIFSWPKKWCGSTRGNGFHLDVSTYARRLTRSHGHFSPEFFTVALNDFLHGFFPRRKGLRQGNPMLPTIFLLSMEYFSRLKLKITHLFFADDVMLFSRGDIPSIHVLMECLQEFRDASGLTVNTSKSRIFTVGIQNEELDGILAHTEFARGEMPVRPWHSTSGTTAFGHQLLIACGSNCQLHFEADWNLSVQLFRGWSVFGSKFSHFQRRSSRKSTDYVGTFYRTLGGHRSLGRKSAIPRKKVDSAFGTYSFGTWPSLPVYYGTFTARQTCYGCSGSTVSTLEVHQSGTDNRRRGILHSFNGLSKFATGWPLILGLRRQRSNR